MKRIPFFSLISLLTLTFSLNGQENQSHELEKDNSKAARYYKVLVERPDSNTLFSRFFESWLETRSIADLETFLMKNPNPGAGEYFLRGRFFIRQGKDQESKNALQQVVNHQDATPSQKASALVTLSDIAFRDLDFREALDRINYAIYQNTLTNSQDSARTIDLAKRKGKILIRLDQHQKALAVWKDLFEKHPDDRHLQEDVIKLLTEEGLYKEAIAEQKLIIDRLKSSDVYQSVLAKIELGHIYRRSNNLPDAIKTWSSAIPATGQNTWIEREIISLIEASYRQKEDLPGLRQALANLLKSEPQRLSLHRAQARLFTDLQDNKAAVAKWQEILQLTPGKIDVRLEYIETLARLKRPKQAADQLIEIIKLNPDDAELWFRLSNLHFEADNKSSCIESLTTFLDKSDGAPLDYLRVTQRMIRYGFYEQANQTFEQLVNKHPHNENARQAYAGFLFDQFDKPEKAIDLWKEIASTGDLVELIRTGKQLTRRSEHKLVYELLNSRSDEFDRDSQFIREITAAALNLQLVDEAFDWAQRGVNKSNEAKEFTISSELAVNVAARMSNGYDSAIAAIKNPDSINNQCLLALLQNANSETHLAIKNMRELALNIDKDKAHYPLLTLVNIYQKQRSWTAAAETMEELISVSPTGNKSSHIQELVKFYDRAQRPIEALESIRQWKQLSPGNYLAWMKEAEFLERAGRVSEALRVIQTAARKFEQNATVQSKLAEIYDETGYHLEAERILWGLYDNNNDPWKRQGWVSRLVEVAKKAGRQENLIAEFQRRKNSREQSAAPIFSLAEAYRLLGKNKEYREQLLSASSLEPDNLHLIHRVADIDVSDGRFQDAQEALNRIVDKDKTGRTINRIARLYVVTGKIDQALNLMISLPNGKQPTLQEVVAMAETSIALGEWQAAAKFLQTQLAEHPDQIEVLYLHALCQLEAGNFDQAKTAYLSLLDYRYPQPSAPQADTLQQWSEELRSANQYRSGHYPTGELDTPIYHIDTDHIVGPIVSIPRSEIALRAHAVAHLARIKNFTLKDHSAQLLGAGLPKRELVLAKYHLEQAGTPQEIFKQFPQDLEMANWFITQASRKYAEKNQQPIDQLSEAIDLIHQSQDADRALEFALRFKMAEKAESFLNDIDRLTDSNVVLLTGNWDSLKPSMQQLVLERLSSWESSSFSENAQQAITLVLLRYHDKGMTEQWLRTVRSEWRSSDAKKINLPWNYSNYFMSNQDQGPVPQFTPGIPLAIQGLLNQNRLNIPDDIESHLEIVRDTPTLHLVLASRLKNQEHFEESIANLKKRCSSGTATISELMFLAHWNENTYQKTRDLNAATELFLKARKLSFQPEINTLIDLRISRLAKDSLINTDLRNHGVDAAQRLRLDENLPSQLWQKSIVPLFEEWNMRGKTKRPTRVISAALALQQKRYSQFSRLNPSQTQVNQTAVIKLPRVDTIRNQVAQLLNNNRKDAAVRILKEQLPIQAGRLLSANGQNEKANFENLLELLKEKKLVQTVLNEVAPTAKARHLDRARFAALCESFKDTERAEKQYQSLLTENPSNSLLRLRLIYTLAETSPTKALQELHKLTATKDSVFNDPFARIVLETLTSDYRYDITETITLSEAFVGFLKACSPSKTSNGFKYQNHSRYENPFDNLLYSLNSTNYVDGKLLPKLFSEEEVPTKLKELNTRRMTVYGELCKRIVELETHQNSIGYFYGAAKAHQALGKSDGELLTWAKQIIENHISTNQEANWFRQESPMQVIPWYIETAVKLKQPELITKLKESAKALENPSHLVAIQNYELFLTCKPEDFNRVIRNAIGLPVDNSPVPAPQIIPAWNHIGRVIEARPELRKSFAAEDISLAYLAANPNDDGAIRLCYKVALQTASSSEKLVEYLDRISNELFPDGIQKGLVEEFQFSQTPSISARFFIGLVNEMVNNPQCSYATILYAKNQGLGRLAQFNQQPQTFLDRDGDIDPDRFLDFVKSSELDRELQEFETFDRSDFPYLKSDYQSIFADWITLVKTAFTDSRNDSNRPAMQKQISDSSSGSFARELVAAALSEVPDTALIALFSKRRNEIAALPTERRNEITQLATEVIGFQSLNRNLTKSERQTLQWLIENSANRKETQQLEVFASAKSFSEMGGRIAGNQLELDYTNILARGLSWYWQDSFAAFENICALGEEAVATGALAPDQYTFTRRAYDEVINRNMPIESFAFTLALFNSEKIDPLLEISRFTDSIVSEFKLAKSRSNDELPIQVISDFFDGIQQQSDLSKQDTRVAVPIFYHLFRSLSRTDRAGLYEWVLSSECTSKYPVLARHAQAAITITKRSEPLNEQSLSFFTDLLKSSSDKDYGVRLLIASLICDELHTIPETIVHQSINALVEAWQSGAIVPPNYASDVLEKYEDLAMEPNHQDLSSFENALGDRFHRKFLANERRNRYPRSQKNLAINRSMLKTMLGIQTKRKEFASANILLKNYNEILEPEAPNVLSILIRNGAFEMAATQVRTNWKWILEQYPYQHRFDATQGKALSDFLAKTQNQQPWLPVLAEISQATMRDPRGADLTTPWGNQNDRVVAVAKKLATIEFPDNEMRSKAVSLLKRYPASRATIETMTLKMAEQVTVTAIVGEKNQGKQRQKILELAQQLSIHLQQGNLKPWKKALTDNLKVTNKSLKSEIFTALFQQLADARSSQSIGQPQAETLLQLYQWMLVHIFPYSLNRVEISHYIALTYQAGKESQYRDWLSKAPSNPFRKIANNSLDGGSVFVDAAKLVENSRIKEKIIADALGTNSEIDLNKVELSQIQGPMRMIDLKVDRFFTYNTLKETFLQGNNFNRSVAEMLAHCETNPELQHKLFAHACKLLGAAPKTVDHDYINQETSAYQLAKSYSNRATPENDWTTLASLLNIAIRNPRSDAMFLYYYNFGESARFARFFDESFHIWNLETELRQHLEELHIELTDLKLQDYSDCLIPFFYYSYSSHEHTQYPPLIWKAAKRIAEQTQYPVAKSFALAGEIHTKYRNDTFKASNDLEPSSINRMLKLLTNESIPLSKRLSLAHFFNSNFISIPSKNYHPVRLESAKVLAASLQEPKQFVPSFAIHTILNKFNYLEKDSNWSQIANSIEKGWWSKVPKSKSKNGFVPSEGACLAMMHLFCKQNRPKSISQLNAKYPNKLHGNSRILTIMVREGRFQLAKNLLIKKQLNWDSIPVDYTKNYQVYFDTEVEEQTKLFLNNLLGKERFFAQLFIYGRNDVPGTLFIEPTQTNRSDRIEILAKDYKKSSFASPKHRSWAKNQLSREPLLISHFHQDLKKSFPIGLQKMKSTLARKASYEDAKREILPKANFAVYEAIQGNQKPFNDLVSAIYAMNSWQLSSYDLTFMQLNQHLSNQFSTMTESQISNTFEAYSRILSRFVNTKSYNNPTQAAVSHIMIGSLLEDKQMDEWRRFRSNRKPRIVKHMNEKKYMIGKAAKNIHLDKNSNPKRVNQIIAGLLSDEWVLEAAKQGPFSSSHVALTQCLNNKSIDTKWLRENADDLLAASSNKDDLALAIGLYFTKKDDLPTAEKYISIAAAGGIENKLKAAKWYQDYYNNSAKAKATLTTIQADEILSKDWQAWHRENR